MHGVGPSTMLGGRYAVQRRLEQLPRAERWSAHDTTLERDVVVVCFAEQESHSDAALDAARRAAGLDNSRLVRVLDVGRSDGVAFFVEEGTGDGQSLTHLLEQGGLPAEEVRRVCGEVATALEAARARGLHHLQLTPDSVLRGHDGTVKLRGVATAAALAGTDDVDSTTAARHDAVGVVALAYAGLTSRWPLPGRVPGLESAPHLVGGVPAPSEIAAGVPGDLDALCRLTLNEDQGPLTPGAFATQLPPWPPAPVVGLPGTPAPADDDLARTIALPLSALGAGGQEGEGATSAAAAGAGAGAAAGAAAVGTTELGATDSADRGRTATVAPSDTGTDATVPLQRSPDSDGDSDEPAGPGRSPAVAAGAAAAEAVGSALGTAG